MLSTYTLARDHLEQAIFILQRGDDLRSRQLRHILERTLKLMEPTGVPDMSNVLDFEYHRSVRTAALGT